jgi:hypothetical protein
MKPLSIAFVVFLAATAPAADAPLEVGLAETDITPEVGKDKKPVYLAGFGQNRKATGVHDKLYARAVVFREGKRKVAMVSIDVVGFFLPRVERIRGKLPGFHHVMVSSTHNHEGPDTLGLWGPGPFKSGVDDDYMAHLEAQVVKAVEQADKNALAVTAKIGSARAPELLHDGRQPEIKHDDLVVLQFFKAKTDELAGMLVQWNCHPETLSSKNTEVSADYVGVTVDYLQEKHHCPVAYFTGTVGGLMTSLHVPIKDDKGKELADGTWEKTERFGKRVGEAADKAVKAAKAVKLTPLEAKTRTVFIPMDNKLYILGWQAGVFKRDSYAWKGDPDRAEPIDPKDKAAALALKTEVGWLQLGELSIAAIPGEIYPELVLDRVQDPVDAGADFPKAAVEPAIYKQMPGPHRMLIGLANDEIGYIIPKRQWDEQSPFCYGLKKSQYGEINSVGPETAPLLCEAFRKLVKPERR